MPDPSDPSSTRLIPRLRARVARSYPYAVVRRFVELELLERSVALSAQAFIALLPLIIIVVSLFVTDIGSALSSQVGDRFGLDPVTRIAVRQLFASDAGPRVVSWLAVVMVVVTAFSLSRRLGRVYSRIFEVPKLGQRENWRGLVWILLQMSLIIAASSLRQVRGDGGGLLLILAGAGILALWFGADYLSLRILVPRAPLRLVTASALVGTVGRSAMGVWAAAYFARSLESQAQQYGPIGVTFAIYTYLLVGVLVYVSAPLLVTTWVKWRAERRPEPSQS